MASFAPSRFVKPAQTFVLILGLCAVAHAVKFAGGSGAPNDPYQIATAEQLIAMGSDLGQLVGHFVLVNDIDLDPNLPGRQVFRQALIAPHLEHPLREAYTRFTGTFRGGNHVIRHLHIAASPYSARVGLFGRVGLQGRVEDLRLEDVTIEGGENVGGLAGENWGTIARCHVRGTVRGQDYVGGLVGTNGSVQHLGLSGWSGLRDQLPPLDSVEGSIYACSTDAAVDGLKQGGAPDLAHAGGLVGMNSGGLVYACRCTGPVRGTGSVGGLVGENTTGWIRSCYALGGVQGGWYAGGLAGKNRGNILFCYATGAVTRIYEMVPSGLAGPERGSTYLSYWDVQTTGCTSSYGGRSRSTAQMKQRETYRGWGYENQWVLADSADYPRLAWEGTPGEPLVDDPVPYKVGAGTAQDPYQVATAEQFLALGYSWPWFDRHFVLTADIDLAGIDPNLPAPVGVRAIPFSGWFDGNGHTVTGFRLWSPYEDDVGVFGYISTEGLVMNVALSAGDVHGRWNVGSLTGSNQGMIVNCGTDSRVQGEEQVGGLLGANERDGVLAACRSAGTVVGARSAGGLAGHNSGFIKTSCSVAGVTSTDGSAGGLVAANIGLISSSYARAVVQGRYGAGGFVVWNGASWDMGALMAGEIFDCYAAGTLEGPFYAYAGGFVSTNSGAIRHCYSTALVHAGEFTGGFAAVQENEDTAPLLCPSMIESCYWDTTASGVETSAGGTGLTTEQMRQWVNFDGWDFGGVWMICEGQDYPRLRWEGVRCAE